MHLCAMSACTTVSLHKSQVTYLLSSIHRSIYLFDFIHRSRRPWRACRSKHWSMNIPIVSMIRNLAQSIWYHVSKNQWSEHYGLIDGLRLPFFNRSLWLVLVFPSALPSFCICSQAQFQPAPCAAHGSLIHWFILCYPVKDSIPILAPDPNRSHHFVSKNWAFQLQTWMDPPFFHLLLLLQPP